MFSFVCIRFASFYYYFFSGMYGVYLQYENKCEKCAHAIHFHWIHRIYISFDNLHHVCVASDCFMFCFIPGLSVARSVGLLFMLFYKHFLDFRFAFYFRDAIGTHQKKKYIFHWHRSVLLVWIISKTFIRPFWGFYNDIRFLVACRHTPPLISGNVVVYSLFGRFHRFYYFIILAIESPVGVFGAKNKRIKTKDGKLKLLSEICIDEKTYKHTLSHTRNPSHFHILLSSFSFFHFACSTLSYSFSLSRALSVCIGFYAIRLQVNAQ